MGLKSDGWIRRMALEHKMIDPFTDGQKRDGVISYGTSSYGYDIRVADEYKIFTNVYSAVVDPKAFDNRSMVDFKGDVCVIPPNSFALARTVEYFRIPALGADHLPGQKHLRPLRDHRQRHSLRAGMGRLCDARDLQHHPPAGQDLFQRGYRPGAVLRRR